MESHPCSSLNRTVSVQCQLEAQTGLFWQFHCPVLVSIPMCSPRKRSLCVSGMAEQRGLLSTLRGDGNPHSKVKAEGAQGCSAPPRMWFLGKTWAQTLSCPHLEWTLSWALPVSSCTVPQRSFSWLHVFSWLHSTAQNAGFGKISKTKHLLAKRAEENSAFWAETWPITSRNRCVEGTRQTSIGIWSGWSSLGHHLSTKMVPQNSVQHNKLLGITAFQ